MTIQVTVELDGLNREAARHMLEDAGFTVVRTTLKRPTVTVRTENRIGRASVYTDMPAGLSDDEHRVYVVGYAKGCMAYAKKHGIPSLTGRDNPKAELRRLTIEYEWERHPACVKAALSELRHWQEKYGPVLEAAQAA